MRAGIGRQSERDDLSLLQACSPVAVACSVETNPFAWAPPACSVIPSDRQGVPWPPTSTADPLCMLRRKQMMDACSYTVPIITHATIDQRARRYGRAARRRRQGNVTSRLRWDFNFCFTFAALTLQSSRKEGRHHRTNQHQPSATSQTNRLGIPDWGFQTD
jgi:hypothetical protein